MGVPVVYSVYRIVFAPARNHAGLGFCSHKRTAIFGTISVTERDCVVQISRVERHTSDTCSYYTCEES